jgi:hypothetical protein
LTRHISKRRSWCHWTGVESEILFGTPRGAPCRNCMIP